MGLFFVLSGFVLAYNYLEQGRLIVAKSVFWKARFARIYPVYLLAVFITLPLFLLSVSKAGGIHKFAIATVVSNLTLLQAWSPDTALEMNAPGWSLSAETFFYLIFPYAGVLIAKLSSRRVLALMFVLWCAAVLPAAAYVCSIVTLSESGVTALKLNPMSRCPEFLLGVCMGLLYSRKAVVPKRWMAFVAAIGLVIVGAASDRIPYLLIHNGLLDPLFILLILGLTRFNTGATLVLLGEASYGLYILHYPLWSWSLQIKKFLHAELSMTLFFVVYAAFAVLLSVAVYCKFEIPAKRYLAARLKNGSTIVPDRKVVSVAV